MKIFFIILVIIISFILCYCVAGANRAFSTPEQLAQEDEEQWKYIQSKKKIDKK